MKIFIHWLLYVMAILITAYILPGVAVGTFISVVSLSIAFGAVDVTLRQLMEMMKKPRFKFIMTVFLLFIDAFLLLLAGFIVPGFHVASFGWAFLFSMILSAI